MLDLLQKQALLMVMAELLNSITLGACVMMSKANHYLSVTATMTNYEECKSMVSKKLKKRNKIKVTG